MTIKQLRELLRQDAPTVWAKIKKEPIGDEWVEVGFKKTPPFTTTPELESKTHDIDDFESWMMEEEKKL